MSRVCFTILRSLIIFKNLIVAILASLLIYVSFSAMDQDFGMDTLNDNHPKAVHAHISAISAGIGIIIVALSLVGLYGAIRKSKSVLAMYAAIVFFMISILAIIAILTFTMRNTGVVYKDVDKNFVNSTVAIYSHTDAQDIKTRVLDHIQQKLSCCGINSPNDWEEYGLKKIPKSCCTSRVESNLFKYCEQSDYKTGCWKAFIEYFNSNMATARMILYIIIGDGLFCSIAAFSLVKTLKRSLEVV